MSDIETKEIKNNSEQLKHDILDFITRNKDKLDKSMIHILEKLADDGHLTFAEMIYLILNTFIDGKEFDELKCLILNTNHQDNHLSELELARFRQEQELVNKSNMPNIFQNVRKHNG